MATAPTETGDAFFEPAILAEPQAYFEAARKEGPIRRVVDSRGRVIYLVLSYELIKEISLRSADFSSNFHHLLFEGSGNPRVAEMLAAEPMRGSGLLAYDNPEHRRYRALVNAVFATGRVSRLEPVLEEITDLLIDSFIERGECDFTEEFAVQFPTYVIADILGVPRGETERVRLWSDAVIHMVGRMSHGEAELEDARQAIELRTYVRETIQARRRQPMDDLISNLIEARVEGFPPLDDEEIGPLVVEIAVAGNETTRNTLVCGLMQILRHPDQFRALLEDPSLVPNAVEECFRYEPAATCMWRISTIDTEIAGVKIPKGANLLLRYDASNRDSSVFPEPHRFDIGRENARHHHAFGAPNPHRCLGQALARKELQTAFRKLFVRLNNLRIDEEASDMHYWSSLLNRGIGSLRLRFDPGARVNAPNPA